MKSLFRFMRPVAWGIVWAGSLKALGGVVDLLIPAALGVLINEGVGQCRLEVIYQMLAVMVVLTLISLVCNVVSHYYSAQFSQQIGERMRNLTFEKILSLSPESLGRFDRPTLITRVTNDTENIQQAINMCIRPLMRGSVVIIAGVIFSLAVDVMLTIPILIGMIFVAIASTTVYHVTRPLFRNVQRSVDDLTRILRENVDGIRFIKALDKAQYELTRFLKPVLKVKQYEQKAGSCQGIVQPGVQFLANAVMVLVVFVGGLRMKSGDILVGDIFTVINYVSMILMASNMMPRVIMMLSRAIISAERIANVLDCEDVMQYGKTLIEQDVGLDVSTSMCASSVTNPELSIAEETPELEFSHVTFTYPGAKTPSLIDVSFRLYRGQTLGVTGDTGCGKSTLIALVLRFYDPQKGVILFRGKSISCYDKVSLRTQITAALQQFDMFAMGVEENICLDRPRVQETFDKATTTAQLDSLLAEQDGKNRTVTQRGTNLSGGQKQRVSVARTLYREASLTMLDDVSGGLDYYTDQKLRHAIAENYAEKTVIIASQRVSSVQQATNILVLDKGVVAGFGTRETLLEGCEKYQEMCRVQSAGSEAVS